MKKLFTLILLLALGYSQDIDAAYIQSQDHFLERLVIFPNPSSNGNISISFSSIDKQDKIQIKIISLIGKEVYIHTLHDYTGTFNSQINLESAAKGIYMLEVSNGERKETRRFSII